VRGSGRQRSESQAAAAVHCPVPTAAAEPMHAAKDYAIVVLKICVATLLTVTAVTYYTAESVDSVESVLIWAPQA
jgi:hypothetical protein